MGFRLCVYDKALAPLRSIRPHQTGHKHFKCRELVPLNSTATESRRVIDMQLIAAECRIRCCATFRARDLHAGRPRTWG